MRIRRSGLVAGLGALAVAAILFIACSTDEEFPKTTPQGDGGRPAEDASSGVDAAPLPLPTGRFLIGAWCGLPAGYVTQERMDEMKNAGITTASFGCQGDTTSVTYNKQMIALAVTAGMDAIVLDTRMYDVQVDKDLEANLDGIVKDYKDIPGVAGYFVVDEPSSPFTIAAKAVQGLQARDPAHYALVNLLPSYASTAQLGTPSYDEYVANYLAAAKPKVVSYDHYPFLTDSFSGAFFVDLEIMRKHALAAGIPFWQFIQSVDFPGHPTTTAAEKQWEGMQTLAYGGAGVLYFTYWSVPEGQGLGTGVLTRDGQRTAQYEEIKASDARFQAFGRYLVPAKSTAVWHNGALPGGTNTREPGMPIYFPSTTPLVIGQFSVNDGQYVFVANRYYTQAVETDAYVAGTAPEILDTTTGKFVAMPTLGSDPVKGTKVHLSIASADGALIHLPGPVPAGAPGAEAFVGTVRGSTALFDIVDTAYGALTLETATVDYCPKGHTNMGKLDGAAGFWLCVRTDLINHGFYVGNVVADQATVYSVAKGVATSQGAEGWDTCKKGKLIGRRFESNGYWLCMD